MRSFRSNSKVRAGFILFEYSPTRNGENARNFLGAYSGYVVCDGYDGYNKLTDAIRCGCWAHARRKFVEALPTDRSLLANSVAAKGVELCNETSCSNGNLRARMNAERK